MEIGSLPSTCCFDSEAQECRHIEPEEEAQESIIVNSRLPDSKSTSKSWKSKQGDAAKSGRVGVRVEEKVEERARHRPPTGNLRPAKSSPVNTTRLQSDWLFISSSQINLTQPCAWLISAYVFDPIRVLPLPAVTAAVRTVWYCLALLSL